MRPFWSLILLHFGIKYYLGRLIRHLVTLYVLSFLFNNPIATKNAKNALNVSSRTTRNPQHSRTTPRLCFALCPGPLEVNLPLRCCQRLNAILCCARRRHPVAVSLTTKNRPFDFDQKVRLLLRGYWVANLVSTRCIHYRRQLALRLCGCRCFGVLPDLRRTAACSLQVMLHGTIRNDDF